MSAKVDTYYVTADHGKAAGDTWVEKRVDLGKFFTREDAESFLDGLRGSQPRLRVEHRRESPDSQHEVHLKVESVHAARLRFEP